MADLAGIIARHDGDFSPNDRRIAEHVLAHLDDVAFASADDLAAAIGVSKAAVVRFGARLGLGGFGGLQDAAAAGVRRRLDPGDAAASNSLPARWHRAVIDDLERSLAETGSETIDRAAAILDSGEGWLHVFGQRASAAVAEYAYFLLNPMLPNVARVESGESALADHLLDIGPEDRLVAFTFQRYAKLTSEVLDYFHERGAPVVLVTDSAAAPGAASAEVLLLCPLGEDERRLPTAISAVFMIELLAQTLLERNPQTAGRRLDDAERVWGRFGTY